MLAYIYFIFGKIIDIGPKNKGLIFSIWLTSASSHELSCLVAGLVCISLVSDWLQYLQSSTWHTLPQRMQYGFDSLIYIPDLMTVTFHLAPNMGSDTCIFVTMNIYRGPMTLSLLANLELAPGQLMQWPVVHHPSVRLPLAFHIFDISRTISWIELKLSRRHCGNMEIQNC